jgi:hypothetical protein
VKVEGIEIVIVEQGVPYFWAFGGEKAEKDVRARFEVGAGNPRSLDSPSHALRLARDDIFFGTQYLYPVLS